STPTEHVVAVEAGAGVTPGSTDGTAYTHYGLEAGLYRYFGLGTAPGNGATATPLPISSPAGAPPTVSSFTPSSGPAGATVTINGDAFTGATAVMFNGAAAGDELEPSNDPGFGTSPSTSLPAGTTSYKDTGLGSAVYYYRLSAHNSGGQSPYAAASAATISYAALVAGRPGLQGQWRLG